MHINFLYQDSQQRQVRQKQIYEKSRDKDCTFKPKLISKQTDIVQSKESKKQPFHQRLHERAAALKEKAQKSIYEISKEAKKEETFHPNT